MKAGQLARARVGEETLVGRVRAASEAVQPSGSLEGDGLEKAVGG